MAGAVLAASARSSGGQCSTCGGTLPAGLATTLGASTSMMELQGAASAKPSASGAPGAARECGVPPSGHLVPVGHLRLAILLCAVCWVNHIQIFPAPTRDAWQLGMHVVE